MIAVEQNKKCMVVFYEDGTWGMHEHFKRLGGFYDGAVWWLPIERKGEVANLCQQANLSFEEVPIPAESFEALKSRNNLDFFQDQASKVLSRIDLLKSELGIDCSSLNDLLTNESRASLEKTEKGKLLIGYVKDHKKWQKQIAYAEKKERIARVSPANMASNEAEDAPEKKFKYLLENNSKQKLVDRLKAKPTGASTGYMIGKVELKLPGGAITVIAAPSSHGKTAVLINAVLGFLRENPNDSAYFFTYEEDWDAVLCLFLNTYLDMKLSNNNRDFIKSYFRGEDPSFGAEVVSKDFKLYEEVFFKKFIDSGRLRIFYGEMPIEELVEAIEYIKKQENVGLVCIDYMQFLSFAARSARASRQEELKQICLKLKDVVVKTGLPLLLAAQFNREVKTEADLSYLNIGEAGDIERIASLIIGIFNRSFKCFGGKNNINKDGEAIPNEPTIYVEVLKGRGIGHGHNEVFDFDGNSGVLKNRQNGKNTPQCQKNSQQKKNGRIDYLSDN